MSPPQELRPAAPLAGILSSAVRPSRDDRAAAQRRLECGIAKRILVIKPHDQLGDFLVMTPALAALRDRFKGARITLVTREYLAPLAHRQPAADEVLVLETLRGPADVRGLAALVGRLGSPRPDGAFVMNSVSRSRTADLVAAISGACWIVGRSRVGAGAPTLPPAATRADPLYDLDVAVAPSSIHQVDRLLDLVRWTGASAAGPMTLAVSEAERTQGATTLGEPKGARIGIHPTAANPRKCWPLEFFADLASRLSRLGHTPIVFDTPKEPGPARALAQGLGASARWVPAGTLDSLIPQVAALDLMICNDSGVMHIAAALGVPTLSFHSLGRPEEWAPRNESAIGLHAEPIAGILPDDAERAAIRLLERASSRG